MRILQISSARHFGGGERHLTDLARGLTTRGHEVFVALRPTNEWQDRLDFISRENFLHVSIRNSFGMFSAKRIGRFLQDHEIDIVHAHVARDYLAAGVAARMAKHSRLVLTRHVLFPLKPFHRFALNNVDAAVAVSPGVAKQLKPIFPSAKIHLISNGLDLNDSEVAEPQSFREFHGIQVDVPLITTIGELKPRKGQLEFLLAAAEVKKRVPDARFVVVGVDNSGGKRFRRDLRRLAKTLGLNESVLWLDWIENTRPLLAATDLFVSPSQSESFGLAILEAMAAGKAVVATATEGATTLLDDPALLVPIKEPVTLANRIVELITLPNGPEAIGERLQTRARDLFSMDRFISSHEELYRKLLS